MFQRSKHSLARRGSLLVLGCLAPLALVSCGGDDEQAEVDQLDQQLTGDPAVEGDMDEQILVDPDLAGASGDYANGDGKAADLSSMQLISAGKPTPMNYSELSTKCDGSASCDKSALESGNEWAGRMPKAFPVFPNAKVEGAAGVNDGKDNIRGVRFTTGNAMQEVADYYYTRAKKAGYSAEYVVADGKHILGGTRDKDDAAYVIMLTARDGGGTLVEITASQGS